MLRTPKQPARPDQISIKSNVPILHGPLNGCNIFERLLTLENYNVKIFRERNVTHPIGMYWAVIQYILIGKKENALFEPDLEGLEQFLIGFQRGILYHFLLSRDGTLKC